jgi:hypothetical protein
MIALLKISDILFEQEKTLPHLSGSVFWYYISDEMTVQTEFLSRPGVRHMHTHSTPDCSNCRINPESVQLDSLQERSQICGDIF